VISPLKFFPSFGVKPFLIIYNSSRSKASVQCKNL
jgi:hypothetical protein